MSARVAQWIRRRSPKPKIASSSLAVGKLILIIAIFNAGTMPLKGNLLKTYSYLNTT